MEEDTYIYLTNTASHELYPENTPTAFTNELQPIHLSPKLEWEIGLVNAILPKNFYTLIYPSDYIEVYSSGYWEDESLAKSLGIIRPPAVFKANTTYEIYSFINNFFTLGLRGLLGVEFSSYFPNETAGNIITYDDVAKRFAVNRRVREVPRNPDEGNLRELGEAVGRCLYITFSNRLTHILGLFSEKKISIYNPIESTKEVVKAEWETKAGVKLCDHIIIYSDIVQPSRMGSQLVNLLDAFSLPNHPGKGLNPCIYHKLATNTLSSISIKLLDQDGNGLGFTKQQRTLLVLHVRPR